MSFTLRRAPYAVRLKFLSLDVKVKVSDFENSILQLKNKCHVPSGLIDIIGHAPD